MHSRAIGWWLVHAWRLTDLVEATLDDLEDWRITVAAVGTRAALEEVGCLLDEVKALTDAWAAAKDQPEGASSFQRAAATRNLLGPFLDKAALSSRMKFLSHTGLKGQRTW